MFSFSVENSDFFLPELLANLPEFSDDCTDIETTAITDTTGYLVSSNYETGNTGLYSSGDNCQWHIQDFPGQVIKLSFPEFDIEKG